MTTNTKENQMIATYRGTTFEKGDKVRLTAEWMENHPTAIICGFQLNNGLRFARVKYVGKDMGGEYGNLFTFDEMKKVG